MPLRQGPISSPRPLMLCLRRTTMLGNCSVTVTRLDPAKRWFPGGPTGEWANGGPPSNAASVRGAVQSVRTSAVASSSAPRGAWPDAGWASPVHSRRRRRAKVRPGLCRLTFAPPPSASPMPSRRSSSSVDLESWIPAAQVAADATPNTTSTRNTGKDATSASSPTRRPAGSRLRRIRTRLKPPGANGAGAAAGIGRREAPRPT